MKKHIVAALIASVTVISGAQAGVPVAIDANPEWAVEAQRWTERLKQWQDTVNHYQKQINAYKQELLTKTGIRDVQGLVQSAQSVSKELENIYDQGNSFIDDYIKNPEATLSEQARSLLADYKVTNTCKGLGYTGDRCGAVKPRSCPNWRGSSTAISWKVNCVKIIRKWPTLSTR
uniref:Minor pilin of type IV secretion complex (VirB5) n=1 Tax=Escherichia coli TaxID=562 RepID=A0A2K9UZP1_ECOLX|nr:Minor pilin of type IV secretion complex (VirB5) [Escherichia coli]